MRLILASFVLAAPLALAACGGNPDHKETVVVQQPAQAVVVPAQPSNTVVVPPGSTVRTCTAGQINCP